MQIPIPSELIPFVDQLVQTGAFTSADAVIFEALRRMRDDRIAFDALKATFDEAVEELQRGEGGPLDFEEIKRKVRALAATSSAPASAPACQ